jgi:hypothetical protein
VAELVTSKGLPANVIDDLLKYNCSLKERGHDSLKLNLHLEQNMHAMQAVLGHGSWKKATLTIAWSVQYLDIIEFVHCDRMQCVKWLPQQPALVLATDPGYLAAGRICIQPGVLGPGLHPH